MKKILLIVLLTSFSWGFGQNLSLSQLMSLRTMELDDAETFLTTRGWNYNVGEEETDGKLAAVNFIYSNDGSLQYGEAFLSLMFSSYGTEKIFLQISKQSKYLEYLNAVKSFKPTLVYTGTKDGDLIKIYQGATTTFKFVTSTGSNRYGEQKSLWFLSIYSN